MILPQPSFILGTSKTVTSSQISEVGRYVGTDTELSPLFSVVSQKTKVAELG